MTTWEKHETALRELYGNAGNLTVDVVMGYLYEQGMLANQVDRKITDPLYRKVFCKEEDWQPHINSNQLELLEEKMIKEAKIETVIISIFIDEIWAEYYSGNLYTNQVRISKGVSKTKNEARLNAILQYIEGK